MQLSTTIRLFWRSRGVLSTAVVVASIAAVSTVTGTLVVLDELRNGSLPYSDAPRQTYVFLQSKTDLQFDSETLSEDDYALLENDRSVFTTVGLSTGEASRNVRVDGQTARPLPVNEVSASLFETFGTQLSTGRIPRDWDHSSDYILISCDLWDSMFHRRPDVTGSSLLLDGQPRLIMGVLPCGFQIGFYRRPQLVAPFRPADSSLGRRIRRLLVFAHLRSAVKVSAAQARLDILSRRLENEPREPFKFRLTTIRDHNGRLGRDISYTLLFMSVVFLAATFTNLLTFFSLRTKRRGGEFNIRLALGGSQSEAGIAMAQEIALVMCLVLFGGLLLGPFVARVFVTLGADGVLPDPESLRMSARTIFQIVGGCSIIGMSILLFVRGLLAMERNRKLSASSSRIIGTGKLLTYSVILIQSALAFLLLIMACTVVKRGIELEHFGPGFRTNGLLTFVTSVNSADAPTLWSNNQNALAALNVRLHPQASAMIDALPLVYAPDTKVRCCTSGNGSMFPQKEIAVLFHRISPEYFKVMNISIQAGRTLAEQRLEAVVTREFVRNCCSGRLPLGAHLQVAASSDLRIREPVDLEIVGIAEGVREISIDVPASEEIYIPTSLNPLSRNSFIFAFAANPPTVSTVRSVMEGMKDRTLADVQMLSSVLAASLRPYRTEATILAGLGAAGLTLSALSVFCLIANSVADRKKELALRIAVGATPVRIVWESMQASVLSVMIGAGCAWLLHGALLQVLRAVSEKAEALDKAADMIATILFLVIVLVSALVPALESRRIEPATQLREL